LAAVAATHAARRGRQGAQFGDAGKEGDVVHLQLHVEQFALVLQKLQSRLWFFAISGPCLHQ